MHKRRKRKRGSSLKCRSCGDAIRFRQDANGHLQKYDAALTHAITENGLETKLEPHTCKGEKGGETQK